MSNSFVICWGPLSMEFSRQEYWVAISYSRGSFQPSDRTHVTWISCTGMWIFYHWATWEAQDRFIRNEVLITDNFIPKYFIGFNVVVNRLFLSLSNSLLLVHRNATNFFLLILYPQFYPINSWALVVSW